MGPVAGNNDLEFALANFELYAKMRNQLNWNFMGFFQHTLDSNFYLVDIFPIIAQVSIVRPEYLLFEKFDVNLKFSGSAEFLTFGNKNTFNANMPSGSVVSAALSLLNMDPIMTTLATVVPIDFSGFGYNDAPNAYMDPSYLFNFDVDNLLTSVGLQALPMVGSTTYYEFWVLGTRSTVI